MLLHNEFEFTLLTGLAGGTKVIRCEISLDDGKSWRLADISRFEQPNWADKHWCWVHYSLEVPIGASHLPPLHTVSRRPQGHEFI